MHPLKQYLSDVQESIADFSVRVGVSRQTLYRIINRRQSPKPALARRIVEATGGAVTFDGLFFSDARAGSAAGSAGGEEAALDQRRLKTALAAAVHSLGPRSAPEPPAATVEAAARAAADTYAALLPVAARRGPALLRQALRPVLEETLGELGLPPPSAAAMERGVRLASDLYFGLRRLDRTARRRQRL